MLLLSLLACAPSGAPGADSSAADSADSAGLDSAAYDSAAYDSDAEDSADTGPIDTGPPEPAALAFDGDPPRSLLLISIDTLRMDRVTEETMPLLLARSGEGYALPRHRSCSSWTYAAMVCALSGLRNTDLGFVPAPSGTEVPPLPGDARLLAQALGDAGFYTELISTSPFLGGAYDMSRGHEVSTELDPVGSEVVLPEAEAAIAALPDERPWFLHVHLMDPHAPYDPPEAYADPTLGQGLPWDLRSQAGLHEMAAGWSGLSADEQSEAMAAVDALYAGELLHLDTQLDRIWVALETAGQLDDALILVMSDHGEQFSDHQSWFHGASLYGEESDALAFFWSPRLVPGEAPSVTAHEDLAPTALRALGLGGLGGEGLRGDEGDRLWTGLKADQDKIVLAAERSGWRLHYWWDGARALYDLQADPGESVDRYGEEPEVVEALWAELGPEVERVQALLPSYPSAPVDPGP